MQVLVECARASFPTLVGVDKLTVGHDGERLRVLEIELTGGGQLQQAIMLNVLTDETGNHSLTDHRIPYIGVVVVDGLAIAKLLKLVVVVAYDVVGGTAAHKVDDILLVEAFLHRLNG